MGTRACEGRGMNKARPSKPSPSSRSTTWRPSEGPGTSVRRLDRGMLWSLMIFLLSFPMMLLFLAVIAYVAELQGITLGSSEDLAAQQTLNTVFIVLSLCPLTAAFIIGLKSWRQRRQAVGLAVAVLSAIAGLGLVLLPSLA